MQKFVVYEGNFMKKIIISVNILWGIVKFRTSLIQYLNKKNVQIIIVGGWDNFSKDTSSAVSKLNVKYFIAPIKKSEIDIIQDIKYLFYLIKLYKKEKPNLVLHYTIKPNIFGGFAAKIAGVNSFNTINGLGSAMIKPSFLAKIVKKLYKISLRWSKRIIFQNDNDLELFVSEKIIIKNKSILIRGSGVNCNRFELPIKNHGYPLTFMFFGRLLRDKGIYEFIDAIDQVVSRSGAKAKFILAGIIDDDNPSSITLEEINQWIAAGLISYLPSIDDAVKYYKLAHYIVLPSYREGLSKVLLEAASCRRPIITTSVPGCKDIVTDSYNGFLCDPKDSNSLSSAITKAIQLDKKSYYNMANNGRKKIMENFTSEKINDSYYNIIRPYL